VQSAWAGDASRFQGAAPAAANGWSGFYAGVNAGYGFGDFNTSWVGVDPTFAIPAQQLGQYPTALGSDFKGFMGGIQLGYNWQFGNVVAGLETDFDLSGIKSSATNTFFSDNGANSTVLTYQNTDLQTLGTVRGRLGWLWTPSTLIYGTGGLAYGKVNYAARSGVYSPGLPGPGPGNADLCPNSVLCFNNSTSETLLGYAVGAGLESKLADHWTTKIEYLYFDLGSISQSLQSTFPAAPFNGIELLRNSTDIRGSVVRIGLNYQFN
jgi:outer membrane immunogenic protein